VNVGSDVKGWTFKDEKFQYHIKLYSAQKSHKAYRYNVKFWKPSKYVTLGMQGYHSGED